MASLSHNPEFSEQQPRHLEDIARNGSAEGDEYAGYGDNAGQSSSFDDLDPATLLQSLADFEHPAPAPSSEPLAFPDPPTVSETPVASESHFQSLLQAVATADGEEAAQAQVQNNPSATRFITTSRSATPKSPPKSTSERTSKSKATNTSTKRKQPEVEYEDGDDIGFLIPAKYRRQKKKKPDELAQEREIWGPDNDEENGQEVAGKQPTIAPADARAMGVHSVAALFRRPSAASRKYTRPPMSTLYTSLELNAEQFLVLQAAAKKYMLDENCPERSDAVGNRSKGDTDMTKLKLFACVKSFLVEEGWGEKCWGASAPGAETRKLQYPELMNKIISLVTPLMRRMVTNERQRLYACESRAAKLGQKKSQGFANSQGSPTPTPTKEGTPRPDDAQRSQEPEPSHDLAIDPKLNQYPYNANESATAAQQASPTQDEDQNVGPPEGEFTAEEAGADDQNANYLINIMKDRRRLKPVVALATRLNFLGLVENIKSIIDDESLKVSNIKVLGPGVWLDVGGEEAWKHAIAVVRENEFMDGEIKCVVEVDEVEL